MLQLPKLFEASNPIKPEGLQIQIVPGTDPTVTEVLSTAGLIGATVFINAAAPTIITTTVLVDVSTTLAFAEIAVSTTTVVPSSIGSAVAAGATTAGIALIVIALGIIADKRAKAKQERSLAKQRDAIDNLNNQIEEFDKQEQKLRSNLQNHIKQEEKLLGKKVSNFHGLLKTYQVKQGDSLSKIAVANGINLQELLDANPKFSKDLLFNKYPELGLAHNTGRNPNLIFPGEYIKLPPTKILTAFSSTNTIHNLNLTPLQTKELNFPIKLNIGHQNSSVTYPTHGQLIETWMENSIIGTYDNQIQRLEESFFLQLLKESFKAVITMPETSDDSFFEAIREQIWEATKNLVNEKFQEIIETLIEYNYQNRWTRPEGLLINWILDDMLVQTAGKIENLPEYLDRSLGQIVKGSFVDDDKTTALGTFSEIIVGAVGGFYGVDAPLDIRDIEGDRRKGNYIASGVGVIFIIPGIGALKAVKYLKQIPFDKFKKSLSGVNWKELKIYIKDFKIEVYDRLDFEKLSKFIPKGIQKNRIPREFFDGAKVIRPENGRLLELSELIKSKKTSAKEKSIYVEEIADILHGFEASKLNVKLRSDTGIDGLYIRGDLSNPEYIHIDESKFSINFQKDGVNLNKRNPSTSLPSQTSDAWINDVANRMIETGQKKNNFLLMKLGNLIIDNPKLVSKSITTVDPQTGEIYMLRLGDWESPTNY